MELWIKWVMWVIAVVGIATFIRGFVCLFVDLLGKSRGKRKVRVHLSIFILGIISSSLFTTGLILGLIQYKDDIYEQAGFVIIMLPLIAMGFILVMVYANYQIKYDDTGFTYRNIFGIKSRYNYADVTGIIDYDTNYKLVVNEKKQMMLHECSTGTVAFIRAIEQWRKNNNKERKKLPKKKGTILNGNVVNAENFVAGWIIIVVCTGTLFFSSLVMSLPEPSVMEPLFITGTIWLLFIVAGFIFRFFIINAEKYPRILKSLIGPDNIKNPIARQKLGLKPLRERRR